MTHFTQEIQPPTRLHNDINNWYPQGRRGPRCIRETSKLPYSKRLTGQRRLHKKGVLYEISKQQPMHPELEMRRKRTGETFYSYLLQYHQVARLHEIRANCAHKSKGTKLHMRTSHTKYMEI